jgi:hypothetical protein
MPMGVDDIMVLVAEAAVVVSASVCLALACLCCHHSLLHNTIDGKY